MPKSVWSLPMKQEAPFRHSISFLAPTPATAFYTTPQHSNLAAASGAAVPTRECAPSQSLTAPARTSTPHGRLVSAASASSAALPTMESAAFPRVPAGPSPPVNAMRVPSVVPMTAEPNTRRCGSLLAPNASERAALPHRVCGSVDLPAGRGPSVTCRVVTSGRSPSSPMTVLAASPEADTRRASLPPNPPARSSSVVRPLLDPRRSLSPVTAARSVALRQDSFGRRGGGRNMSPFGMVSASPPLGSIGPAFPYGDIGSVSLSRQASPSSVSPGRLFSRTRAPPGHVCGPLAQVSGYTSHMFGFSPMQTCYQSPVLGHAPPPVVYRRPQAQQQQHQHEQQRRQQQHHQLQQQASRKPEQPVVDADCGGVSTPRSEDFHATQGSQYSGRDHDSQSSPPSDSFCAAPPPPPSKKFVPGLPTLWKIELSGATNVSSAPASSSDLGAGQATVVSIGPSGEAAPADPETSFWTARLESAGGCGQSKHGRADLGDFAYSGDGYHAAAADQQAPSRTARFGSDVEGSESFPGFCTLDAAKQNGCREKAMPANVEGTKEAAQPSPGGTPWKVDSAGHAVDLEHVSARSPCGHVISTRRLEPLHKATATDDSDMVDSDGPLIRKLEHILDYTTHARENDDALDAIPSECEPEWHAVKERGEEPPGELPGEVRPASLKTAIQMRYLAALPPDVASTLARTVPVDVHDRR